VEFVITCGDSKSVFVHIAVLVYFEHKGGGLPIVGFGVGEWYIEGDIIAS
jgi:hypothetical protein